MFFTRPQLSPSGVSLGQTIPQYEDCSDLGPVVLRVFSNCELILVSIPRLAKWLSLDSTWLTPIRLIRNLRIDQFPVAIALFSAWVIRLLVMCFVTSNWQTFTFGIYLLAVACKGQRLKIWATNYHTGYHNWRVVSFKCVFEHKANQRSSQL